MNRIVSFAALGIAIASLLLNFALMGFIALRQPAKTDMQAEADAAVQRANAGLEDEFRKLFVKAQEAASVQQGYAEQFSSALRTLRDDVADIHAHRNEQTERDFLKLGKTGAQVFISAEDGERPMFSMEFKSKRIMVGFDEGGEPEIVTLTPAGSHVWPAE